MTTHLVLMPPDSIEKFLHEVDDLDDDEDEDDDEDDSDDDENEEEDDEEDDDDDDSLSSVSESSDHPFPDDHDAKYGEDDNVSLGISLGALMDSKDASLGVAPGVGNRSMPDMQFDIDMSGIHMSEDDNRSLAALMTRMNSSKNLCYFQDAPDENDKDDLQAVPAAVDIAGGKKKPRLQTSMDDLALTAADRAPNPHSLFLELIEGLTGIELPDSYWETYFDSVTEERMQAYAAETVKAVRNQDLKTLKEHLEQNGRAQLEACNKQGESIIHLACRRRNDALVRFLVQEAKVSLKVRDDWGKTPLHELCWNSRPKARAQFDTVRCAIS